jgi:hypothetical protein
MLYYFFFIFLSYYHFHKSNIIKKFLIKSLFLIVVFLSNAEMMNQNFDVFLPNDLNVTLTKKNDITLMIRNFYFDGKELTINSTIPFITV